MQALLPTLLLPLLVTAPQAGPRDASDATAPAVADVVRPALAAYRPAVERLLTEGFGALGAYPMLVELCTVAPHRLSGSEGNRRAVAWAVAKMEALGLENVRAQEVDVPHWVRGDVEELQVVGADDDAAEPLSILALGGSVGTPEAGLEAEVVEVTSWEQLAELGAAVRGKAVFYNRPFDPTLVGYGAAYGKAVDQRSNGANEAAKLGAAFAIVRSMTASLDDYPHTGAMRSYQEGVPQIPSVAISTLGAERLSALLKSGRGVTARLRLSCETLPDAKGANVIGELRGSELPDEVLVVGGHLDGWDVGQGASDDGTGCVQALEVVRLMKTLELRPRRTIRVVLFANEENGTRGALAYHEGHREEMERHVLAMESDSGGFTPRGFHFKGPDEALDLLNEIGVLLRDAGIGWVRDGYTGVDIAPMMASFVPTMGFVPDSQRYFDVHHSNRDTLAAVSPRELQLGACAMAAMLYVVADMPLELPRSSKR